ncbi:dihydrolipoamide acetyltransferase family protein [Mycolicibacterium brumae]|uniref:Dihydrolipoamide acetyltransferase component of pyruvate dehydrogenase complex n=1 Tax=Mycolicibacterium brumae TaxID=85968 RepID=A0A2G5PCM4_9MYCO|nr:dihydrolipoamide acetyltransferase family protein [Mycolicibacterium brumae]MCV7191420.1 2-oxo acid dehydrogenase subunit E2 [Mycolicibacterium brumae]PIB75763.1 2-oxo acid dehydrogenase subunit E2 [Mycolicibacterium brumae]RWA16132.1 hypothetical protein MBRU_08465 [Mycolicibacterium brumae DSM 44177]UWW09472.1 2-oxo acid dehydrogenase subunit E2 [Mycolicibacterium brumae]
MTTDFCVPDLGEGLEEATIVEWNVGPGDEVELNQTLCTLETAKAAVEIPSPRAGRVVALGGEVDQVLAVGAPLVRFEGGEPAAAQRDSVCANGAVLVGYGTDSRADRSRRSTGSRPRAKPSVRKLAAELGVDLGDVEAGPDGIVTREAVLAGFDERGTSEEEARRIAPAGEELVAVRGVRAEMAKRMSAARREIPDAHAGVDVDCARLLELAERIEVSPFVLTLRMLVLALGRHRILNAGWVDGPDGPQLRVHRAVHLGFGVAAPRGLLVPVVRDAQAKTTRELALTVATLIEDARSGRIRPAELVGSTFTVSNFGALGLDDGVPVINHPEAAILGMGAIRPRAVVIDGELAVRPTMRLTCAFDHRVADGAQVAAFLTDLRALIEAPETALADL